MLALSAAGAAAVYATTQVLVHNVKDLEMLMMHNRVFCAEVGVGRHTGQGRVC